MDVWLPSLSSHFLCATGLFFPARTDAHTFPLAPALTCLTHSHLPALAHAPALTLACLPRFRSLLVLPRRSPFPLLPLLYSRLLLYPLGFFLSPPPPRGHRSR